MKRNFLVTASPTPSFGNILKGPGPFSAHLEDLHGPARFGSIGDLLGLPWIGPGSGDANLDAGLALRRGCAGGDRRGAQGGLLSALRRLGDRRSGLRSASCAIAPAIVFIIHYFGFAQPAIERIAERVPAPRLRS